MSFKTVFSVSWSVKVSQHGCVPFDIQTLESYGAQRFLRQSLTVDKITDKDELLNCCWPWCAHEWHNLVVWKWRQAIRPVCRHFVSNRFKLNWTLPLPPPQFFFRDQYLFFLNLRAVSQGCGGVTIYMTVNVSLTERGKEGTRGGLGRGSQLRRIIFINPKQIFVITGD